ncbi:MAG: YfhO family protein [Candidatus Omnitrophota bacterium]|nr:YfhO family protein [Candidatus Omnitrophota bacterium]
MLEGNIPLVIAYTLGLYLLIFAALFFIRQQLREKKNYSIIVLLIVTVTMLDLALFSMSICKKVLLERRDNKFNEKPVPWNLPKKRILNLISEDVFRNFRPGLYKKHTALGSYPITQDYLDVSTIAKVYIILNNESSKYPLYKELNELNIKQFISYGMSNLDQWPSRERLFFATILRATIEGFMLGKDFYSKHIDVTKTINILMEEFVEEDPTFSLARVNAAFRDKLKESIIALFNLPKEHLLDYENEDYLILDKKMDTKAVTDFYNFLFEGMPARDYLFFLFEKMRSDEHTFVLLKDYYELISSNKTPKEFKNYGTLFSPNLRKVLGVTAPIIRYYPDAFFTTRENMLLDLASWSSKEDILYLEAKDNKPNETKTLNLENSFSYKVLRYNPNLLDLKYTAPKDGYLYFSDSYDNYWNAYIDGKKTDIYKANVAFKAVKIPQGNHKISFIYDPKYFRISLWCYYLAFAACGTYLLVGAFINMRKS